MSSSTHQIKVKAVDQTSGAFSSIQKRATATGANIRRMLGGAIAAAAGYLGVRQFIAGVDELGRLSDTAMKASTSVDELTSAATALSVLGIKSDVNSIATAFTKMAQNTGRTGMSGFFQTIEELGKIEDITKRSDQAMKIFGRAGLEFMPLINAANDGSAALQKVIDAMPKIPQAAADAGDKLADAKTIGVEGFKSLWLKAIGKICDTIDDQFEGGVREAALNGVSYFSYFASMSYSRIKWLFNSIGIIAGAISANWKNVMADIENLTEQTVKHTATKLKNVGIKVLDKSGLSEFILGHKINVTKGNSAKGINDALDSLWKNVNGESLEKEFQALIDAEDRLRKSLETEKKKNKEAAESVDAAAKSTGARAAADMASDGTGGKSRISNTLILGGSNDAMKLSILGPQTQELKKQTTLLNSIKENTKNTAENIDDLVNDIDTSALKEI